MAFIPVHTRNHHSDGRLSKKSLAHRIDKKQRPTQKMAHLTNASPLSLAEIEVEGEFVIISTTNTNAYFYSPSDLVLVKASTGTSAKIMFAVLEVSIFTVRTAAEINAGLEIPELTCLLVAARSLSRAYFQSH